MPIRADQPDWYKDAIFYEVYVCGFFGSTGDGNGDLRGLTERLDYLKALCVDCLWLMPIYESPLKDDGYDIADFRQIHHSIGNNDDFRALTADAHERGLRIIADLVLNHTSDSHPWCQADAVPYLFEREGTNCENLPETHGFLKESRTFVETNYPGALLLAEANQWPSDLLPYFGEGDEFQAAQGLRPGRPGVHRLRES